MRMLSGASRCGWAPRRVTSRAKAAISSAFLEAKAGSANGARASSAGDGGRRSRRVALPRIATDASPSEITTAYLVLSLSGRVRNLCLSLQGGGLVIRGLASTYHAKQLAQHAVMAATAVPILANEIQVRAS